MSIPAPAPELMPTYPASWFLFGRARDLRRGPVSRDLLGHRLVAFRTASGRPVVLDARCAHLGADLGEGCVVGEELQCAFHNWRYGPDGRCSSAKAAKPAWARLRSYPAAERHGYLFFFNGPEALFPLPFFADADPGAFVVAPPLRFYADCPWYLVNGNSFDVQHFRTGHGRDLLGEPAIDCPHPFARRIRLTLRNVGDSVADRLLRRVVGDCVRVSMTNWGGSVVVVTGDFRHMRSSLITFIEPIDGEHCFQNILVYARRGRIGQPFDRLRLWLRRRFTHSFMAEEFQTLAGIRYQTGCLVESDRPMIDFFQWLTGLPQGASAAAAPLGDQPHSLPLFLCKERLP
jgi:aminopyrrolnitrin oxygenase